MTAWRFGAPAAVAACVLAGCSTVISGSPTWPGATLEKTVLKESDFPPGVGYGRIVDLPGQPDGAGGPAAMLSVPQGCSNGLTDVIAKTAERGPGSAAKYAVSYEGAHIVMTLLTWHLPLDQLDATASRCARFNAYFDPRSQGIPITTVKLPGSRPDQLVYQQTMRLGGTDSSVYMAFENIDRMAMFGMALPTSQVGTPQPAPKATLPRTFLEIADKQAGRINAS